MKSRKYTTAFLGLCILLSVGIWVSCKEYLDKTKQSSISEDQAFKNFDNFQGFVEELYSGIPDFSNAYWTNSWNWGDDEVTSSDMNYQVVNYFDNENMWGWQTEHNGWDTSWMDQGDGHTGGGHFQVELWSDGWYAIRKADLGLDNINKMDGTQEEKDLIKGQLLFFRAWYYFQFMQYFGGLPYLTKPLPADAQFDQKRLNYQATADSAAKDFRKAADLLPIDWDNTSVGKRTAGNNALRINKIMALGYLGKDLLWAGSPLMKHESSDKDYDPSNTHDYDKAYCKKAADVFAELLNLVESGQANYSLVPFDKYQSLFTTIGQNWKIPGGTEAIFRGPYYGAWNSAYNTAKQYQPGVIQDKANFYPTANYVDNFGMKNGLPITDPNSGYDPQHPWRNRDPRFYKDFIYDGEKVIQGNLSASNENLRYASLYTGGTYRDPHTGGSSTGFLLYKFIPKNFNKFDVGYGWSSNLNIHLPWMRLGGVYIMYAEAAAEGYGINGHPSGYSKTPVDAINMIRDRAGVGHVHSKFTSSLNNGPKNFIDNVVRREWAVELAYEKHRFTNLRRWLLLTDPEYANKTGAFFDRANTFDPNNPRDNMVLNYKEKPIVKRKYIKRDYWLPFKTKDVNISASFKQNPGY